MSQYIQRISRQELDLADLSWLAQIAEYCPWGQTAETLTHEEGWHFWRIRNGGLLTTQILIHPAGKELVITGLAGEHIRPKELWEFVNYLAKTADCKWIGCCEVNQKLVRIMMKFGLRPLWVRMTTEVSNG